MSFHFYNAINYYKKDKMFIDHIIIVLFVFFKSHNKKVDKDGDGFFTRGEFVLGSSEQINKRGNIIRHKAIYELF